MTSDPSDGTRPSAVDPTRLRSATVADLDAIMVLESGIFAGDAWSAASMRRELTDPNCVYVVVEGTVDGDTAGADASVGRSGSERVARADGDPTVIAYAGLLSPRGAHEADIQTIAVAATHRRHGIGRLLMETLTGEARARGAREVFLEVRADNPAAQTLYRQLGFEEIGVRAHYYQPDDVDAVVMRRRLEDEQ